MAHLILLFVNGYLLVDQSDHFIYGRVRGRLKILGGFVVCFNHAGECLLEEGLGPLVVLHEVEDQDLVKVAVDLLHVLEVKAIVQLGKLEDHIDHLRLVGTVQATVLLPVEDALAALEDQVGANWVLCAVESRVPWLLLRQKHNCGVVLAASGVRIYNGVTDVAPNIGRIVSVEVDNRLLLLSHHEWLRCADAAPREVGVILTVLLSYVLGVLLSAVLSDLIQVILISLSPNDVNDLVEGSFGVVLLIVGQVVTKDAVVRNLAEGHLGQHALPLMVSLARLTEQTGACGQVILSGLADVLGEG